MSRTDNTRPYALQANDPSLPGYVHHMCGGYRDCDYLAGNGAQNLRQQEAATCRRTVFYGPSDSGARSVRRFNKRLDVRESRRNARHQLQAMIDADEFDLLPCRSDRGSNSWYA